jgi:hypothetical protein
MSVRSVLGGTSGLAQLQLLQQVQATPTGASFKRPDVSDTEYIAKTTGFTQPSPPPTTSSETANAAGASDTSSTGLANSISTLLTNLRSYLLGLQSDTEAGPTDNVATPATTSTAAKVANGATPATTAGDSSAGVLARLVALPSEPQDAAAGRMASVAAPSGLPSSTAEAAASGLTEAAAASESGVSQASDNSSLGSPQMLQQIMAAIKSYTAVSGQMQQGGAAASMVC